MRTTSTSSRKRLPRAEQVEQNRAAVLAAAGRVFREHGYTRASLDAIAEEAGFSKGVIYSQFASKADLFITLLEQRIEARAQTQRETVLTFAAAGESNRFIAAILAVSRADPQWQLAVLEFRIAAARDPELNARYARAHQRTIDGIAATLRTLFAARGAEPDIPVETLAVAGMTFDAGALLEDLALPGSMSESQAAVLLGRLLDVAAVAEPPTCI